MPSRELFIGGLDRHCTQTDLENTFEKHGKITRCSVKNSGKHSNDLELFFKVAKQTYCLFHLASGAVFAFIEFEDENSAEVNREIFYKKKYLN